MGDLQMTPGRRPADDVARDLRFLADALLAVDATDDIYASIAPVIAEARQLIAQRVEDAPPRARVFSDSSVFSGVLNVNAPPLVLRREATSDESGPGLPGYPVLAADVTLGRRYEGPADCVHGGVISGVLDEMLGATVSQVEPGRGGVTGKLKVRFQKPTPIDTPLTVTAWITEDRGRIVIASASCAANGVVTVIAEGMFIRLRSGARG